MNTPKRKTNRLSYYDYSTPGAYFITICTQDRLPILGRLVGGGALDAPRVLLTEIGQTVYRYIVSGNNIPGITVDKFVIMPNHIHLILLIDETASCGTSKAPSPTFDETASCGTSKAPSPTNALIPHFVSTLKRFCHRDINTKFFQRSYHDHIIRNEKDYLRIWQYIDTNPIRWKEDCFYTPEH